MADIRLQKLAKVLVQYSLRLKPGDKLNIMSSDIAAPLIREVYREALRAGAHPETYITIDGLGEILLREGNDEQLTHISELERVGIEYYDAVLTIWAQRNTRSLSGADPARMALRNGSRAPLFKRSIERIASGEARWCGTLFPTHSSAQDAGMSLSDYEDFVYGVGMLDQDDPIAAWGNVYKQQQRIVEFLEKHDEIHIIAPGTDITYRVGGRKWINCAGTENFPDGEVFSGPIENSVNGNVRFTYPAISLRSSRETDRGSAITPRTPSCWSSLFPWAGGRRRSCCGLPQSRWRSGARTQCAPIGSVYRAEDNFRSRKSAAAWYAASQSRWSRKSCTSSGKMSCSIATPRARSRATRSTVCVK